MNRICKAVTVAGLGLALLAVGTGTAVAAPATPSTSAAPAAINSCTGGSTYIGSGSNNLSNGVLTAGFCVFGAGGTATANFQYQKNAGSTVTVRFAWEFVDSSGSNPTGRVYDNGSFSISSGQTKSFQWSYASPGRYSPSGQAPCRRGVLISGADTFSTRVVC